MGKKGENVKNSSKSEFVKNSCIFKRKLTIFA